MVLLQSFFEVNVLDAESLGVAILMEPDFRDFRIAQEVERCEAANELERQMERSAVRIVLVAVPWLRTGGFDAERSLDVSLCLIRLPRTRSNRHGAHSRQ